MVLFTSLISKGGGRVLQVVTLGGDGVLVGNVYHALMPIEPQYFLMQ